LYDPGIVIVCQGVKRGYLGGQVYQYDAQHYLAVSVPVPFTMETDASAQAPLLAIYLHLDLQLAADLLIELGEQEGTPQAPAQSMMSSPMQAPMQATVLRLLEALAEPLEAVLGPALVREVYFRVLTGAQGGAMREALAMRGRFGSIGRVLRTIHADMPPPGCGATGHRSGHECGDLPRPLPRDYRHVADAVREVDPPAPGAAADAAAG
jgi:hypothetical protein